MARQKKTDTAPELDTDGLPELTPSQLAFVYRLLAGDTGADAYRAAYSTGDTWSNEAIWVAASRLRHHTKVKLWLSAARQASMDTGKVTLESHIAELSRLKEICINSGNMGAAVQAEVSRGKACDLYRERFEMTRPGADILDKLAALKSVDPDAAALLMRLLAADDPAGEATTH